MSVLLQIVDYNPAWPGMFEAGRDVLSAVLRKWITADIQHIGSTAVAALAAKPEIDIMVPVGPSH